MLSKYPHQLHANMFQIEKLTDCTHLHNENHVQPITVRHSMFVFSPEDNVLHSRTRSTLLLIVSLLFSDAFTS